MLTGENVLLVPYSAHHVDKYVLIFLLNTHINVLSCSHSILGVLLRCLFRSKICDGNKYPLFSKLFL